MALIFGRWRFLILRFDQISQKHGKRETLKIIIFNTSVYSNVLELTENFGERVNGIKEKWRC